MRTLFVVLCFIAGAGNAHSAQHFDGRSWWDVVSTLADDRFEGRNTGSSGERAAQEYMVNRLKALGIPSAGISGYFQPVELRSRDIVEADSSLALLRGGSEQPLTLGKEAFFSTRVDLAPRVQADLVFAGYGLRVPEQGYDDFAGLNLQ